MKAGIFRSVILICFAALIGLPIHAQDSQSKPTGQDDENVPADRITIHQLKRMMDAKEEVVVIDTRKGSAYVGSTVKIKGAIHITVDELEAKMKDLPKKRLIVTYCT